MIDECEWVTAMGQYHITLDQWRTEGVRVLEPPLTWQKFCLYFNHTECGQNTVFSKILKKFCGQGAQPPH